MNKFGRRFGIDNLEEKLLGSKAMTLKELLENEDILDMDSAQDLNKNITNLVEGKNITINSLNDLKKALAEDDDYKYCHTLPSYIKHSFMGNHCNYGAPLKEIEV